MALTSRQKKYLRKHYKRDPLPAIAIKLGLSEEILLAELEALNKNVTNAAFKKSKGNKIDIATIVQNFSFRRFLLENWPIILFLIGLVVAAYANAINNEFLSDDIAGIRDNKDLTNILFNFQNPYRILHFLFPTVLGVLANIFGKIPQPFRITNIVFHAGNVILVFIIVTILVNRLTAAIAASITAVHPILIEAVSWISGGGHNWYTFFLLLSILLVLLTHKSQKYWYLAAISFGLATTVSEKSLSFPFLVLALILVYKIDFKSWKKLVALAVPFGIIAILFLIKVPERIAWLKGTHYQNPQLINPLFQVPVAIGSYLILIFWPDKLSLYHSELNFTIPQFIGLISILLAYLAITVFMWFKNKPVFVWLAGFFIGLMPTLLPFGISWVVAERYAYFSSICLFIAVAILIGNLAGKKNWTIPTIIVVSLIVVSLLIRTIVRNVDWKNQDNLWLAADRTSPTSSQNHNNLGDYYLRHGNYQKAIEEFGLSIKYNPNNADAYHNMANVYLTMGNLDKAIEIYQQALKIGPGLWQSHRNLAAIYFEQKKMDLAKQEVDAAISINNQDASLWINKAVVYGQIGDNQTALSAINQALALEPTNETAKKILDSLTKK